MITVIDNKTANIND